MVEEQQKVIFSHSWYYERNYVFGQEFSFQTVSIVVTEWVLLTK